VERWFFCLCQQRRIEMVRVFGLEYSKGVVRTVRPEENRELWEFGKNAGGNGNPQREIGGEGRRFVRREALSIEEDPPLAHSLTRSRVFSLIDHPKRTFGYQREIKKERGRNVARTVLLVVAW
jgi:hypothetical protein